MSDKKYVSLNRLSDFLKKLNEKFAEAVHTHKISDITDYKEQDLTDFALKSDIPSIDGLATETFVKDEVAKAQLNGGTDGGNYDDTELRELIDAKADKDELFSGDYNDLINRPTIPLTSVFASKTYVDQKVESVDEKFDGLKLKRMTQAQYDALVTKDSNTLYIVVSGLFDDSGSFEEGVTDIYSISWTTGVNLSDTGEEVSNSSQASYRTTDYIAINPDYNYRIYTSISSQFTIFYYNKNKKFIGHSRTIHDAGNNTGGVYEYVMNGFINELDSAVQEDIAYIRIRTNNSTSDVTVEEMGAKDDSDVPYTLRNGWSIVSNTGAITGGSGAAGYMMVDNIELEPYYEYDFTFKGTASTKMYLYDTDQQWIQTLPSTSGNYTSSTNTVKSSDFPEGTRYVKMRTANSTVGIDNAHEHLKFTKTPIKSKNILEISWIDNSSISSSTGSSAENADAIRSDFIALTDGYDYVYSLFVGLVGFRVFYYDTNKQFLSCDSAIDEIVANEKMNIPSGAKYIRVRADKTNGLNINTVNDIIVIKRLLAEENLLYTFGLLSDVHVDNGSDGDAVDFGMSVRDYRNALRFLEDEGAEFIAYTGDMTKDNSGYGDYEKLLECVSMSNIPNYLTGGNHDVGKLYESMVNPNKYYTVEQNNDLFIFINVKDRAVTGGIDQQTVNFVRNTLENNPNRRVFLMYHYFIRNHGSGDGTGGYYTSEALGDDYEKYPLTKEWTDLIINTPNLIFCHGHSHMRFNSQDRFPTNNLYHADGECYSLHVPSCAIPRKANTSSVGMSYLEEGSEGYIVKVFPDRVEFRAIDFTTNTYLTAYNQVVDLPESTD